MSLRRLCPQRIASVSAHRAVWRQPGVRYYTSQAANDPEWFQQLRAGLLSRKPIYQREDLNALHHAQLLTTLEGFVPWIYMKNSLAQTNSRVAHLLTRFNLQVPSAKLLPDGTDPLHSPGEPWVRRMWAGGAVQLNPDLEKRVDALKMHAKMACVERIKDVRLQGGDDTVKIFVTIERRFALVERLRDRARSQAAELDVETCLMQQVRDGVEWGNALLKEERHLVFLKAKTGTELMAIQAGQTHVPRYLKSPTDPEFTHTLTPTRSLLFRYSALTFNAHLLHLDPTYARNVEGHRNLLVHGPLTLTLMLQTLTKRLQAPQVGAKTQVVESVTYRNLAPLYCDEQMRVCVKRKTRTDTGDVWNVWIEGPTGDMAVKATMRTANRKNKAPPTERAVEPTTDTALPDVATVAAQARDSLNALEQDSSGTEQVTRLSREERRKLWRANQRELSRSQRKAFAARALPYLYSTPSPLSVRVSAPTQADQSSATSSGSAQGPANASIAKPRPTPRSAQKQRKAETTTPQVPTAEPASVSSDLDLAQKPSSPSFPSSPSSSPNEPRPTMRSWRRSKKLVIRKIEQVTVRKTGGPLGSVEKLGKQKIRHMRKALKKATLAEGKRVGGDEDKGTE